MNAFTEENACSTHLVLQDNCMTCLNSVFIELVWLVYEYMYFISCKVSWENVLKIGNFTAELN